MSTGYRNEDDEDAKIIIKLIKKRKEKKDWPVFELLEAVHATFPPELGNCRENLERTKNHRNKEIRQQICFVL